MTGRRYDIQSITNCFALWLPERTCADGSKAARTMELLTDPLEDNAEALPVKAAALPLQMGGSTDQQVSSRMWRF